MRLLLRRMFKYSNLFIIKTMKKTSHFLLAISQPFLKLQQKFKKENVQKGSGYMID